MSRKTNKLQGSYFPRLNLLVIHLLWNDFDEDEVGTHELWDIQALEEERQNLNFWHALAIHDGDPPAALHIRRILIAGALQMRIMYSISEKTFIRNDCNGKRIEHSPFAWSSSPGPVIH